MTLGKEDEVWLRETYPGLVLDATGISGTIEFTATYDEEADCFVVVDKEVASQVSGRVLSCKYQITISEQDKSLPALRVDGVAPVPDRHFVSSGIACLCSPFVEGQFLRPAFQLRRYFRELVIPFLYGQQFFTEERRWPWRQYAHGGTGLLEAYLDGGRPDECLQKLKLQNEWPSIRQALRKRINGNRPCFCKKGSRGHRIKRCHPRALEGLRPLKEQIEIQGLTAMLV